MENTFDHEEKSLILAIGLTNERVQEVELSMNTIRLEEEMKDVPRASIIVEKFSKDFTKVELALALFSLGRQLEIIEREGQMHSRMENPIDGFLKALKHGLSERAKKEKESAEKS